MLTMTLPSTTLRSYNLRYGVGIELRRTFHGELLLHLLQLLAISDQQIYTGAGSYILQVLRLLGVEWLRHFDGRE